jgi:hypothetical protein
MKHCVFPVREGIEEFRAQNKAHDEEQNLTGGLTTNLDLINVNSCITYQYYPNQKCLNLLHP